MLELALLIAIAYAGARGVEAIAGTTDRRHRDRSKNAEATVAKIAASGPEDKTTTKEKKPGPTEPGGTFSAAAPRSAALGGKAAVPLAVLTETGATMWKATLEGYRERWPQIREEHRRKMTDRAAKREAEKKAAAEQRKAEEALAKAGPPPPHPPRPTQPPTIPAPEPERPDGPGDERTGWDGPAAPQETTAGPEPEKTGPGPAHVITTIPAPRPDLEAEAERERAETASKEAEEARTRATAEPAPAARKAEQEAAAGQRARAAADGRPHLSVVPTPERNGDTMASPVTIIPEIRTLDGLMQALALTSAMCQMRAEEAEAVAAGDLTLSNRLDQIETEMADLEVDDTTRAEIDALRDLIHTQAKAAAEYSAQAKDAADLAVTASAVAYRAHGGIAEAIQSSPIEAAAQAGYYER